MQDLNDLNHLLEEQILTRDQAIALCGIEAVERVENASAELIHHIPDGLVEFSTTTVSANGLGLTVRYYWYPAAVDAAGNLRDLDWKISHYSAM
jgi:hypothetical protein